MPPFLSVAVGYSLGVSGAARVFGVLFGSPRRLLSFDPIRQFRSPSGAEWRPTASHSLLDSNAAVSVPI